MTRTLPPGNGLVSGPPLACQPSSQASRPPRPASGSRPQPDLLADEQLSLDRLARQVGMTRSYLSRLFAEQTGLSLTAYRNHLRLTRALYPDGVS